MVLLVRIGIDERVALEDLVIEFLVDFQSLDFSNLNERGYSMNMEVPKFAMAWAGTRVEVLAVIAILVELVLVVFAHYSNKG